jgi:glycine cleavage system aminomethyltransferase T
MHDLAPGRIRYALRLDIAGNVLSDITIWRHDSQTFEIFAGRPDEFAHLQASTGSAASVCDVGGETAIFAVQGPLSLRALARVASIAALKTLPYFAHAPASIGGINCHIGRLGYTGERGFEIILPKRARETLWALLAEHAQPAGFAAADVLRIEAGFSLFSNEFLFPVSPSELGLERFAAAPAYGEASFPRVSPIRLISFQAQCDYEPVLWQPSKDAAFPPPPGTLLVTSACRSIVSGEILGLGYACNAQGVPHLIDPSGHFREIREVVAPFHDARKYRPRGGWDDDLLPADADSFV